MARRAELATDLARAVVFDDRVDDAGAAGRGVGPRHGLALELRQVGGGNGIADGNLVGGGGRWRLRDGPGGNGMIDLGRTQEVGATAHAARQG